MAALSQETQAIIAALKAEGDASRDTSPNSIRSIKTDLSKFDSLFQTISDNTVEQTDILRQSLIANTDLAEINAERARRDAAYAELSDDERSELDQKRLEAERMRIDNDLNDEIERRNAGKENKGLFGTLKTGIGKIFNLKNIAVAAGAFAILPFAYGFINELTGGGFDKLVDGVKKMDFSLLIDNIGSIAAAAGSLAGLAIVLSGITTAITGIKVVSALTKFVSLIGTLGSSLIPSTRPGTTTPGTTTPPAVGTPPPGRNVGKFLSRFLKAGGIIGMIVSAYSIFDIITDTIEKDNADPDQVPSEVKRISEMYRAFQSNMLGVMKMNAGEALNKVTEIRDDLQEDLNEDLAEIQQMKDAMSGADDRTRAAMIEAIKESEADIQNQQKIIANVNKSVEKYTNELQKSLNISDVPQAPADVSDVPFDMAHDYKAKTAAQVAKAAENSNSGGTTVIHAPQYNNNFAAGDTLSTTQNTVTSFGGGNGGDDGLPVG